MNFQVTMFFLLTGWVIGYYINEYTHITHTQRVLSRKVFTKSKEIDSIRTRKVIGSESLQAMDPVVQFSHIKMKKGQGLMDHPHRGYDTITYVLAGELAYEDFRNNSGILYKGDAQWLTAGKGIVHAEVALTDCELLQIWILLNSDYRLCEYQYQNMKNEDIINTTYNGVSVKILAGETLGRVSPTITRTSAFVMDAIIDPNAVWDVDIPAGWNALVYVLRGEIRIDEDLISQFEAGMLSQ